MTDTTQPQTPQMDSQNSGQDQQAVPAPQQDNNPTQTAVEPQTKPSLGLEDIAKGDLSGITSSLTVTTGPKIENAKIRNFFELMHVKGVELGETVRMFLAIDKMVEEGTLTDEVIAKLNENPSSVLPENQQQENG